MVRENTGIMFRQKAPKKAKSKWAPSKMLTEQPLTSPPIIPQPQQIPQKPSFFGTNMERPSNVDINTTTDEYGVIRPQQEKAGLGKKLLEYLLPTLFSASSGAGVLPGIFTGIAAQSARRGRNVEAEQEYGKERTKARENVADADYKNKYLKYLEGQPKTGAVGLTKLANEKRSREAFNKLDPESRKELENATQSELRILIGDPDIGEAANYLYNLKNPKRPEYEYPET